MELLLALSALLSALTGVTGFARPAEVRAHQAAAVERVTAILPARLAVAAHRPADAPATLLDVLDHAPVTVPAVAIIPAFAERRRE